MKNIRSTDAHTARPFLPCLYSPYCQCPTMFVKHFNILLILTVAIIGAYDCYYEYDYSCLCDNYTYQSAVLSCLSTYCAYEDTEIFVQALQGYCTSY
ncbi:hypothetical protein BGW80DRAFT_1316243 [Lactifluus volemus]|nr:hypothetical protein BGW80DRAFT_1316243 [Lactifluus volemus]